jgi:ferritin-like metal-binding protein YciE
MKTLRDLLVHELKDLYSAEKQLTKALPKMAKAASHSELKDAFTNHLDETNRHVERLEQAFDLLDVSNRGAKCEAMVGLIAEGEKIIKADGDPAVLDAGLISAAQRVEHYEMAGYGCARTFAQLLGESAIAALLQQTLDEESAADETLTSVATSGINQEALHAAEL